METEKGCMNDSKRDLVRTVNVHAALRFLTLSKPVHAAAQVYLYMHMYFCMYIYISIHVHIYQFVFICIFICTNV
jgi:hypothetical protein